MSNPYKDQQQAAKREWLEARCMDLYRKWKKVEAVKLYRSEVGCGLREALEAVQNMAMKR